ncbi:glycerophosphodiester phosphodiesterase [Fulvivirga ligni]|uniref:glycerophosphodiester phosphodiesterase n=1 Tax=Fulvivirga ligni TaxID=2904246 RepID=UPI001F1A9EB9|nr:glycerophosphodiester phosphodiesterase family protein [Fulvivirga ligni]UII19115.1 glycerophosphodiester phosphodiesterase [Fulvivirga ligni]
MRRILLFALMPALLFNCQNKSNESTNDDQMDFAENQVIAHRGAWKKKNLPENSIASLEEAIRLGCTASEFDIWMTADSILVVNHDKEFFGHIIEESTYDSLKSYKLTNGETIPTLEQYLNAGMQQRSTRLVLEIKPSVISKERGITTTEKVVATVKQLSAEPWAMFISFDYDIVKKLTELMPAAEVGYLNGDVAPDQLHADGINGLDYHFSVFEKHPDWVKLAKDHQVSLNSWTVNDTTVIDNLLRQGFDYITTNEPELVFERIELMEEESL